MSKQIEVGTQVRYAYPFTLYGKTEMQTGVGLVLNWDIVGTDRAWVVEVTESPVHKAGEVAHIRQRHCTAV